MKIDKMVSKSWSEGRTVTNMVQENCPKSQGNPFEFTSDSHIFTTETESSMESREGTKNGRKWQP